MSWLIKLVYLAIIVVIIMPIAAQWNEPLEVKQKQSFLPPTLPELSLKNNEQLTKLLATNLWHKERGEVAINNKLASQSNEQEKNIKWMLKGIGMQRDKASAVITTDKETNSYYQGDKLPDGAKLLEININSIVIEHAGETHNVYLFK